MRTEKSPTRMDCSAFKRSSSSGDAPPLTRLSGISAGTAVGDGPLVLSSPTGSLFGCIVSSGADEPPHDVTGAGALSRPYEDAAAIFGLVGLRQSPLGIWDWNRSGPPTAGAAMARAHGPPTGCPPRWVIHRPDADECPATGWIRPCPSTPRCVQVGPPPDAPNAATIQWFRDRVKISCQQKTLIDFKSLAPRRKGLREGGTGPGPVARRANQGAKDTTQTTVSANEAGRAAAPCAFLLRPPCKHCLAFRR